MSIMVPYHAATTGGISRLDSVVVSDSPTDALYCQWSQLLNPSTNVNVLFQSPAWVRWVRAGSGQSLRLVTLTDSDGSLVGGAAVLYGRQTLEYCVKRRNVWRTQLNVVEVLGSELLPCDDISVYDSIVHAIEDTFPDADGLWFPMLSMESRFWEYLSTSSVIQKKFLLHVPDGVVRTRLVELPESFEKYLQTTFHGKTRQELRRQIRMFQKHDAGPLALRRYTDPADVNDFLTASAQVVDRAWQSRGALSERLVKNDVHWFKKLTLLAENGVFRSYVLFVGDIPAVYMLGYQHRDVYLAVEIGHDPAFSKFSPGTVAMLLRIEDLIQHQCPKVLSFGYGDAPYKEMLSNSYCDHAVVFLLRRTVLNRIRRASHSAFRGAVAYMKRRRSMKGK